MVVRLKYVLVDRDSDREISSGAVDFFPDSRETKHVYDATYLDLPHPNVLPGDIGVFRGIDMTADFKKADFWIKPGG